MITKELLLEGFKWREKMKDLAEASQFPYDLLYLTFQTVMDYYGSANKDTVYWCDILFKRCCMQKIEMLSGTDWEDYPTLIGGVTKSKEEDLDISALDAETVATLKLIAQGGELKAIHAVAMRMVVVAMHNFMDFNDKHPFDYVLDAKEDFETFFKIETAYRNGAEN